MIVLIVLCSILTLLFCKIDIFQNSVDFYRILKSVYLRSYYTFSNQAIGNEIMSSFIDILVAYTMLIHINMMRNPYSQFLSDSLTLLGIQMPTIFDTSTYCQCTSLMF